MKMLVNITLALLAVITLLPTRSLASQQRFPITTTDCSGSDGTFDGAKFVKSANRQAILEASFVSYLPSASPAADDQGAIFDTTLVNTDQTFLVSSDQIVHRKTGTVCAEMKSGLFGVKHWKMQTACKIKMIETRTTQKCARDYFLVVKQ